MHFSTVPFNKYKPVAVDAWRAGMVCPSVVPMAERNYVCIR